MRQWATRELPKDPDRLSPSGMTEIRLFPSFDKGEIVHATAKGEQPSVSAILTGAGEFFYVLEGEGRLWRATGDLEDVVPLHPGRCVTLPPGIEYQYRTKGGPLKFLVATVPRWQPQNWDAARRRHWDELGRELTPSSPRPGPWVTKDLPKKYDYLAPDGSEIRLLPSFDAGGLAHCRLPAGALSAPVRHRTVKEVWYVLAGRGQVWRAENTDEEVVEVKPGTGLTIPTGVHFRFLAAQDEPLEIMIGTFPAWPGPDEAEPVPARWPAR